LPVIVDEQAFVRLEAKQATTFGIHSRVRLAAAEDLGDREAVEVVLNAQVGERGVQAGPVVGDD
jgi:hypothetical protein